MGLAAGCSAAWRVANVMLWNIGFLVFGALLVVAGYAIANTPEETSTVELRRAA